MGCSKGDVVKFLGGTFLRVFDAVWKSSTEHPTDEGCARPEGNGVNSARRKKQETKN